MRATIAELLAAVRDILRITFVTPVREGRPRPATWPPGLPEVGVATALLFGMLGLASVFAVLLRTSGALALSPGTPDGVPVLIVPLLLTGVVFSTALAATAAIRATWWLRLVLLALVASVVFFFGSGSWLQPLLPLAFAVPLLVLTVFVFVRARRAHAWWEFVVVAGLVLTATVLPWAWPSLGASLGVDSRPMVVQGALFGLQPLILPAVMVAGSAPAQIVVTGAQATATRPVGRGLFRAGFVLAVGWLVVVTRLGIGADELSGSALVAALVALAVAALVTAVLLRRDHARTPPEPRHYPEVWGAWLYPLAAAMTVLVIATFPLIFGRGLAVVTGQDALAAFFDAALNLFLDNNPGVLWRAGLGLITLVLAWRLSGRSRLVEAVALGAFSVLLILDGLGLVPTLRFLQDRSNAAVGLLASLVALAAAGFAFVRRRLDRVRAAGVLTVVLLAVLYPHRGLIADPLGTALASTGALVLVFGLAWRVLTEGQVTSGSSRRYPQETRVLLFLANTLFATTGVAYVSLSRGLGTDSDPTPWGELGDSTLGDPLYFAGLVAALWLVLRPPAPAPDAVPPAADAVPPAADAVSPVADAVSPVAVDVPPVAVDVLPAPDAVLPAPDAVPPAPDAVPAVPPARPEPVQRVETP